MKYLITAILLLFTLNANAQSLEIGSQNFHLGVSYIDSQQSAYLSTSYDYSPVGIISTRVSLAAGVLQKDKENSVYNSQNKTFRAEGVTESKALGFVRPSIMAGFKLPVSNFNIGLYTGYQSVINSSIDHQFVPFSMVLSF